MADIDTLRHGGWTAFTDNPLRAADAITSLLDENERLRERLAEIASQAHNLPRSATADRIDELARAAHP